VREPAGTIDQREAMLLLGTGAVALVLSGLGPFDRTTWWLEIFPILLVVPLLLATARRFPLTPLLYRLILIHALILMVGGHWSYARVPAGFWVQDLLGWQRNPYDRLGHLAQGFIPAIAARELFRRRIPLPAGRWLAFLVVATCLAISACYELVEWWAALALGQGADEFLGTQGDPWDTQWDMFLALVGAILAQLTLSRVHDRQLRSVTGDG
jgi:putative membrane protein